MTNPKSRLLVDLVDVAAGDFDSFYAEGMITATPFIQTCQFAMLCQVKVLKKIPFIQNQ